MALRDLVGRDSSARGLTPDGVSAIIREHRTFDRPSEEPVERTQRMLEGIVEYLQVRDEPHRRELVQLFFEPDTTHAPKQLRYVAGTGDEWFADVAAPQLRVLPCVEAVDDGDSWRFDPSGVDPDSHALDDEHVAPIEEVGADPELQTRAALAEQGIERGSDEREALLELVDRLREMDEEVTTDELDGVVGTGLDVEAVADDLAALPGVERTVDEPPAPEDITVETMADVIEGREALEAETTETWRYDPDAGD